MADPDAIYELASRLESNIDIDKRIVALHTLQSQLESAGYIVEADAVTSAIRTTLKHSNQALSSAALAFVPTYASLIYSGDGSESHAILNHNVRILVNSIAALVIDKLGDGKERIRESARTALVELGNAAYAISSGHLTTSGKGKETETPLGIFERAIRENGLGAKFARIREQTVLLLPILRQNCERYPVRPLLPITVDLLSDADATVREGARSTLVSLFANATPAAKADLKKELEKRGTRKQTADAILRDVLANPSASVAATTFAEPAPASKATLSTSSHGNGQSQRGAASYQTSSASANYGNAGGENLTPAYAKASSSTATASSTASAAASAAADDIRPVYIASRSDLERTFATMLPSYEGRESEHNWLNREQSMIKIRGLIVSGAHRQYGEANFVAQLRTVQEGILKCVASLRTTLSMHAIHLVSELAMELGDDLGPCVEGFLIALTGMAGFTKKIVANATQEAAAAIMVNVSFRPLYLQLVWQGYQDKNVATRTFAAEHLATILTHHAAHRKHAIEGHGGLDLLDKCLRKGASDSNPAARSKSREAFWIFHQYWTDHANAILNSLDPPTKKQVMALAPAHVDVEAVVEHKPKTTVPVRARPGGASSAILQAKKAAALKAAQERERRKAEEAAEAHEAKLVAARAAAAATSAAAVAAAAEVEAAEAERQEERDTQTTPVAPSKRTGGFMPTRNRSQQYQAQTSTSQHSQQEQHQRGLASSEALSILVSPNTRQRIETAVTIPLPTSPPPALDTPRTRTSSMLSQPSSGSSNPRSPGLSPVALRRGRAISSSSQSSHGSSSASTSTPSAARFAAIPAAADQRRAQFDAPSHQRDLDLADLSINTIANDDDAGDMTEQPRTSSNNRPEDDTVQLGAPEDASMDLMGMDFSSPFKLPPKVANVDGPSRSGPTHGQDLHTDATPNGAKARPVSHQQSPLASRTGISSTPINNRALSGSAFTSSSTPGSATPGKTVRRSGLPRPVSMIHSPSGMSGASPAGSPLGHFTRSTSHRTLSTSSGSSGNSNATAGAAAAQQAKTTSSATSSSSTTSPTSDRRGSVEASAAHEQQPPPRSGATGSSSRDWMSNRASRLEQSQGTSSPAKSKPETWAWIAALSSGSADLRVFRKLAKLSSDFKVSDGEFLSNTQSEAFSIFHEDGDGDGDNVGGGDAEEPMLRAGPASQVGRGVHPNAVDDGHDGNHDTRNADAEMFATGTLAWQHAGLFDALFSALKRYLVPGHGSTVSPELQMSAQVLLHRLLENQYPLFPASGRERETLDLVLTSIGASVGGSSSGSNSAGNNGVANGHGNGSASGASGSERSSTLVSRKASLQAWESILTCWAGKVDPVLGFDMLLSCVDSITGSVSGNGVGNGNGNGNGALSTPAGANAVAPAAVMAVVLRSGFTPLLVRLPGELMLEDFLPRISSQLSTALRSTSPDERLNATTLVKKLNDKLKHDHIPDPHQRIFATLSLAPDLDRGLMDLLMHYFSKK
ncbi:hypothetical protein BCV70DRAFT_202266 [Testicularia cyperi]|uniref:TOG domain-containing protein n=1 Tax=Testicularia cyperi TaxID=1882483 RepID=A0A317XJ49_9BASI|nr:hypothetical protein BCV70DRAFT_202266 [Testicularia cyperi]